MSEWISVKDKIPSIGDDVIVYCPDFNNLIRVSHIFKEKNKPVFSNVFYNHNGCKVTHWMPFPEPPKK